MRYTGSLVKKEREKIFELFLHRRAVSFHEIEAHLMIRSNLVSYHLQQMIHDGLLAKAGTRYSLTPQGERYLPIFAHVIGKEMGPVPVVLVAVLRGRGTGRKSILLIKRAKRPYQGYWSLVGGKMHEQESVEEAAARLVEEKTGIMPARISTHAIMHERISDGKTPKYSFILFLTSTEAKRQTPSGRHAAGQQLLDESKWFSMKKIDMRTTIPSDRWLIVHKLGASASITNARMQEHEGTLSDFLVETMPTRTRRRAQGKEQTLTTHKKKRKYALA